MPALREADAAFAGLRPRLVRIAYRMLGTMAEAEDVVQEAWIRWQAVNPAEVRDASAYLGRTVARLCLDHIRSARVRRETYVGSWLPEPLVEPDDTLAQAETSDAITLTLMVALERLSPLERAAFLLHDIFDLPFTEIATAIDRDEAACRQLAARARRHVRAERPRFPLGTDAGERLARAFFEASTSGDVARLRSLLAADVVAYADGGGKVATHFNPIIGRERLMRLFAGLAGKPSRRPPSWLGPARIDGLPGFLSRDQAGHLQTTALAVAEAGITAIYTMRNLDKLARLAERLADPAGSGG